LRSTKSEPLSTHYRVRTPIRFDGNQKQRSLAATNGRAIAVAAEPTKALAPHA